MNRAITSTRHIILILALAALVAIIAAWVAGARSKPFYFELAMRSSCSGTAQLFYDVGEGFNEEDSVRVSLRSGESMTVLRFGIPAGKYNAIRLDPVERGECRVTIRDPRLIDLSGRILRNFRTEDFTALHDISASQVAGGEMSLSFGPTQNDPNLTLALAAPLTLRPSITSLSLFASKMFLLYFIPLSAVGLCWWLFAPRRWTVHALLLPLLVAFVYLDARSCFLAPISFDEEAFIWFGWLVNHGSVPYRDIFEPKGPVIFFVNALGLAVFGLQNFLFRIVPTAVALASIFVLYLAMIKRRVVPWLSALLTAQVALWLLGADFHDTGLNDSETYGFAFTILGLSFGWISGSVSSRFGKVALQVLSGVSFGLAVLSKELFVFSVIPAWLIVARRCDDRGWDWRQLLFSAVGGVAIGISFLIYLITHSAFGRYLEVLRFSKTFAANYCVDIGRFPRVSGLSALSATWKMLHERLYNFDHLAFVLVLALSLFAIRLSLKQKRGLLEAAIATAAVVLGMVAVSIGHCFWRHYFLMGTTGLFLLGMLGAEALSACLSRRGWPATAGASIVLTALFSFVASGPIRVLLVEKLSSPAVSWDPLVVETIEGHSKPGDYVLATGGPLILVAMDRRSPYLVDERLPSLAAANSALQMDPLRAELEEHLPKVCYFPKWIRPSQRVLHELLYDPLLAEHHYIKVNDELWYLPEDR
jgi:hypothetical protein